MMHFMQIISVIMNCINKGKTTETTLKLFITNTLTIQLKKNTAKVYAIS